MKIQESRGRYFVTIPEEKVRSWKLQKGDIIDFNFDGSGNLVMTNLSKKENGKK